MPRPPASPSSAPDSAPEIVAEIRRLRQLVIVRIANAESDAAAFRRMDAGLTRALAGLGYPAADDPAVDATVRLVQGLDDVRGQVEHLETRGAQVEQLLAAVEAQQRRLIAAIEVYTTGVAELAGGVDAKVLASDQYSAQALELLRQVLDILHKAPGAITNAVSAALPGPHAVEVGRRRREADAA